MEEIGNYGVTILGGGFSNLGSPFGSPCHEDYRVINLARLGSPVCML